MEQLSFDGILEEVMTPSWPKCFGECRNFSNLKPDGTLDYFMNWAKNEPDLNHPRCVIGLRQGNWNWKLIDNHWHSNMKCFEPKEGI